MKDKNKIKFLIKILIFFVVLLVFSFFAFNRSLSQKEYNKELQDIFSSSSIITSMKVRGDIKITTIPLSLEAKKMIEESGKKDFYASFQGDFDLVSGIKGGMSLNFLDQFSGEDINLNIKTGEEALFVQMMSVPSAGILDFSKLKDKWVKLDMKAIREQNNLSEELEEAQKIINKEQIKLTKEAFVKNKVVRLNKKLEPKVINDENLIGYAFYFNKKSLKNFIKDVDDISGGELSSQNFEQMFANLDGLEMPEGELWIGEYDLLPRQIYLVFKTPNNQNIESEIYINLSFSNFGEPVNLEIPTEFILFEDLSKELGVPLPNN